MQGEDGYSDKELQELILKSTNSNLRDSHKNNAHNILCAGLTEILIGYFQNMEYTKTTTFDKKNKNKKKDEEASNLYIYDARLREVLRQFIKGILKEYQNISQKNFEKELAIKLEKKNIEDNNEGKSLEVRLNEDMNLFKQASKDYLNDIQEDIKIEFTSIIPEVENRVSCLLWEQYEKVQKEQKKKEDNKEEYINKDEKSSANSKWLMWGLATVGSGIIIGVTGGLAAPLVGAGLGTIGLGLESLAGLVGLTTTGLVAGIGTFLTTTSGVAIFGALFGLTGGGLTGKEIIIIIIIINNLIT